MPDKFAVFILSHKRAKTLSTPRMLRRCGYSGAMYVVISDDEPDKEEYLCQEIPALVYSRERYRDMCDIGDTRQELTMCSQARNACFDLAADLALDNFAVFDDDYTALQWKYLSGGHMGRLLCHSVRQLDGAFHACCLALNRMPRVACLSFAQGGDFAGGTVHRGTFRKMMNAMIFRTDTRVRFVGRYNDDITAYVLNQQTQGAVCLTVPVISLTQPQMSQKPGGMSEAYIRDGGGYVKAMYAIMRSPSAIRLAPLLSKYPRVHTAVLSDYAYPHIVQPNSIGGNNAKRV